MNVQIFLTVWLLIQLVTGTVRAVRYTRLKGKSENDVIAAAMGHVIKITGMFLCLYIGGFYS